MMKHILSQLAASLAVWLVGTAHSFATLNTPNLVLGRPTDTAITVNVLADTNLVAYFEYGTQSTVYASQTGTTNLPANQPLEMDLTGLRTDTRYFYRLNYKLAGDPAYQTSSEYTFHTRRPPGSTFTFCMHGDTHPERAGNMFNADLYTNTLIHAAADQPDFYMTIGDDFSVDNIPTNLINQALVVQRYTLQRPWLGLVAHSAPLFLVNGNHEQASLANFASTSLVAPGVSSVTLSNIAVWAQTARNLYYPEPVLDGAFYSGMTNDVLPGIGSLRSCYAWTWGDALFVTLDPYWYSACAVDNQYGQDTHPTKDEWLITHSDPQYEWLKKTLEQSTAKYKFVLAHHVMGTGRGGIEDAPYYEWGGQNKDGSWGFPANRPNWTLPIHQLMATNHVTMFVQGHDHIFVRQQLDGVTYLTLPLPADNYYQLFNADAYPNCIYKTNNSGYVRFTVSPAQVKVEYVRTFMAADIGPGKTNGLVDYSFTLPTTSNQPPAITAVTTTPAAPFVGNPILITALVTDVVGVASVTLNYSSGAASITNTVFLETMATNSIKNNWTGTGCDNPWSVTFAGSDPFGQATNANYTTPTGNTNGLSFKGTSSTTNLADNTVTTVNPINAQGDSTALDFYLRSITLSGNAGWAMQLDSGTGFTTRFSELSGTSHNWAHYHYDLQSSELVSNLALRFQFQSDPTTNNNRVYLDEISLKAVIGGSTWTNVVMTLLSNGLYVAVIPAQPAGNIVSYSITANNSAGLAVNYPTSSGALSFAVTNAPVAPFDVLLGRPTDSSMAVSVMTATNLQVYCQYGTQSGLYPNQTAATNLTAGTPSVLTLNSLQADTQYFYQLGFREIGATNYSASIEHTFHTKRARGSTFTFDIEADPHYHDIPGTVPAIWQQTLTNILADAADFLIDLGDTFMGEKYSATNNGYSMTQAGITDACVAVRNQFFSISGHSVPLFLVDGNHDPELGWWLSTSTPHANPPVWAATARELYYPCPISSGFYSGATNIDSYQQQPRDAYYAFEWGDALFVMLDPFWFSNQGVTKSKDPWAWTLGTNQYFWLKSTLETSPARLKFVFAHHLVGGSFDGEARGGLEYAPYFEWGGLNTNGTPGFTAHRPGWPMPIRDLLLTNHVQAFFHGHDHLFVKQDFYASGSSNGQPDLIYQELPQPSHYPYDAIAYATGTNSGYNYQSGVFYGSSGHLRVTVSPTNALVEYVRSYRPADEGFGATNRMVSYRYTIPPTVTSVDSVGDGIPDWWRARFFGGTGSTTNNQSCAACDPDGDGMSNWQEYLADTNPTNALSRFQIQSTTDATGFKVLFQSSASRKYTLYYRTNLTSGAWTNIPSQTDIPGSGGVDALTDAVSSGTQHFYRIGVRVP